MKIEVHHLTRNPTAAWNDLSKIQKVIKVQVSPPKSSVADDKVRIVCMSDTHSMTPHIKFDIPQGDIFIHAGDFTRCGQQEEVIEFSEWIGNQNSVSGLLMSQEVKNACRSGTKFLMTQTYW